MKKLLLSFLLMPVGAFATTQTGIQPLMVGFEQSGNGAYIGMSQNPNGCLYGAVYFVSPFDAKAAVSTALSAKISGRTLRMDYSGGNGAQCFGYAIYVE